MVVTGVGVVSSIGTGVEAFWNALADGVSGASVLELDGESAAHVLGISATACSTRLSRALQKLEKEVGADVAA